MKRSLLFLCLLASFCFQGQAQTCATCTSVTTVTVDLSASPNSTFTVSTDRAGKCCQGTGSDNCVLFQVTVHPQATQVAFYYPTGNSGSYYLNCTDGPYSGNTPACAPGGNFCLTYCNPGNGVKTYTITTSSGLGNNGPVTLRPNCTGTLTETGLASGTVTWTAVSPSTTYSTYLSCAGTGCTNTSGTVNVTPTASGPLHVVYKACGKATGCAAGGSFCDTIGVNITSTMSVAITPTNAAICSAAGSTTLTATASGGQTPYTYTWSPGGATTQTLAVTTPGVYTVSVKDNSASGCGPVTQTINVASVTTPTATVSPASQTLCSGSATSFSISSNSGTATYSWTVSQSGVSGASSGSGSSITQTLTTTGTTTGTATYTITPKDGACTGNSVVVTVTVNPTPTATVSPTTQTLCSAGSTTLALSSNVTGTTYSWTVTQTGVSGGSNGSGSSPISQALSATGTSSGTAVYTITPTANGCAGATKTATVTVNPAPTMTSSATATICSGQTVSIPLGANVASTFTWIAADNTNTTGESLTTQSTATLSNTITNNTTNVQTVVYTVTPTSSGGSCVGTSQTVSVTVNPTPAMTSANTATICSGNAVNISLAANVASTFTWIAADNVNTTGESITTQTTSTLNNTITNNTTSAQVVVYSVTPTSTLGSCAGTLQTVSVTVNPTPTMTSANTATICSGGSVNIALTANVASTFTWIATDNANTTGESVTTQTTSTLNNTITNNTTSTQVVVYTVTPSSGGACPGSSQTVSVTVNPTPAMTSASSATICSGGTVNIPLTANVASSFTWIATDNTNTTGESVTTQTTSTLNNTITNNTTSVQTVIYTVTPTSTGGSCAGPLQTVTVTVNPTPAMTSANSATICSGGTVNIPLTANVAATFTWIATDNANTTGESITTQTTTALNNTITNNTTSVQTVIYTVTPTSSAATCPGTSQTVTVTVNPTPAMTSANTATICSGQTVNIALTANVASTFTWIATDNANTTGESITTQTTSALNNTITNNTTSTQTITYTVTPTSTGGSCVGASQTVSVTVNPTPAMTSASSATICSGQTVSIPLTSNVASTYTWIAANNPNTTGESTTTQTVTTISNTLTETSGNTEVVIYSVTPTSTGGSCVGSTQTVSVTVSPTPILTVTPTAQTLCSGNATSINLSSNVTGTSYTWTVTQTNVTGATASSGSVIAQTISTTGTSQGTAVYTISPTIGSCTGSSLTATVTVNPVPVMTSASSATICSGQTVNIPLTANVASNFTWIAANNANTSGESVTTQTTSTLNNTITNSTTSVQTVIYTVTPTSTGGSCTGTSQTVTVTVNPTPAMTSASSATICSGGTVSIPLTSNVASTYTWIAADNTNTTGESLTTQSSATLSNTITNNTTSVQTVIYSVTPTSTVGTCAGTSQTVTVTVNPTPAMTSANTATICSGNSLSISLTANVASTFTWIAANNANTTGESTTTQSTNSINDAITNTTASVQTVIYTVTPTSTGGSCVGASQTVSVTVNPTPAMTSASSATICSGQTVSIPLTSNVASTYTWIAANNPNTTGESTTTQTVTTISNTLTETSGNTEVVIYSVTPTSTGGSCVGSTQTVSVTVSPTPILTVTPTAQTLCSGNATSINLSSNVTGTSYTWTVTQTNVTGATASSGSVIAQTISTTGTSQGTAVYTISPTIGSCTGSSLTATVTVNPVPVMTSASSATICSGQTVNIPLTANVASSFTWIAANNANTSGESVTTQTTSTLNNTITNSTTSVQTVIYTVTPTSTGGSCTGTSQTVTVTVNPTPAMTSASSATICSGGAVSIPLTSNVASTYTWIAADNTNTTGESLTTQSSATLSNTITNNTTSVQTVIYSVTPTSTVGTCAGTSQTVTVTVNPTPAMTSANTATICSGNSLSISLTANVASTFTWIAANNANTTGESTTTQSTNSINDAITNNTASVQTVIYTVTPTSTGGSCVGASQTVSVTVNPTPAMTSASSATICSGQTVNIPLTSNVASTYTWIAANNPNTTGESTTTQSTATLSNTLFETTGNTETVIYTVTPTSTGGACPGVSQTVSVTVSPTPILTVSPTSQTICSGSATSIALSSNVTGTNYTWTVTQTGVSGASNSSGSNITQTLSTTGSTAGTAVYTITPTIGTCSGSPLTATVTVNPIPSVTATPSSQTLCSGGTTNIALTSNVAGASFNWTVSQSGVSGASASSGLNISQTLSATGTSQGTASYTITPSANSCSGTPIVVTVSVNPIPSVTATPSSQALCSGNAASIALSSDVTGTNFAWTVSQSGASGASAGSGLTITHTLTATGASPGTVTYTITPTAAGCPGTPVVATVTVNPIPNAPTASSNSPVCITNTINFNAGTVTGATYSWTGPNGFTSSSQNPSISNATLGDAGTYSVNVTVNGCTGPNQTVTVVVNAPPPSSLSPASNSPVCSSQTLSLSIGAITNANYSWTGPNSFTSTLQNPTIASVTTAAGGTYSLTVTVPGCGASGSGTVAVTVNQTPAAPNASSNSPICAGDSLILNAVGTGTSYNWSGPSSFTSTNQNTGVGNATAINAGVYSVTTTDNGCTSSAGTATVVVNGIPGTPTVSSNSPLCVGATLNLSAQTIGGATYSWTGPNSFSSSSQNPTRANVTTADAGTYSLAVSVNGCGSSTATITVAVNSAPATPVAGSDSPVCVGDTLHLTATTINGALYSWTGPNSFTSTAQNPFIAPVSLAAAGTYTVVANNGCASLPSSITVTVNPIPATPGAGNNSPVCVGGTITFTSSTVGGATYDWSGPNSFTASTQNTSVTGATASDAGTYSVTVTVGGCTSLPGVTTASVNLPAVTSVSGSQTVCANNPVVAITGTVSGGSTTGIWSTSGSGTFAPSTAALSATYTPSNADTAAGNITLTLSSTNNGACPAATSTLAIVITDAPGANAGAGQSVCANNANINLNGAVSGGASGGTWTTSGTGTFSPDANTLNATYTPSPADISAGVVSFTLTTTGVGQCNPKSSVMTATITTAPTVNAGPDQVKCKSSLNSSLNGTVTVTNAGTWSTSGSGTFTPNANTLNATYTPSSADTAAGTVLLILTSANNGGCTPVTDTLQITYTDIPVVNAGPDQVACANNLTISLSGSVTVGSTTGAWSTSGTGTFTPNNTTLNGSYIPSAADTAAGTVTLTLSSTGGCVVVTDNMVVTITDAPGANAGSDISVCANNANASYSGSVSGAASTGIWSTNGSGTFNPSNTSLAGTYIPSGTDISAGSVFLILTTTGNGNCNAAVDSLKLTFTTPPTAFAGNDSSFCANSSFMLNGSITGGGGTGAWTTSGSGAFTPNANALNATYTPSSADTAAGSVTLTLTSTNNGGCIAATDQIALTITDAPSITAGSDQAVCSNNNVVSLNGSVSISTGVLWSSLGDGTFGSTTSSSTTYTPGTNDISNGTATIVITSTGNGGCVGVSDTMKITIQNAPIVNAGTDQFICSGSTTASVSGTVFGISSTGTWSTLGSGTFTAPNSLSTTYSLSPADTLAGNVLLVLTSTGNGSCNAATDTVKITITPAGFAAAGNDTTICASVASIQLNGAITGGTGAGQWTTTGTGTFTPNNTTLNATYSPSAADLSAGSISIKLSPINSCNPTADSLVLTIQPVPVVNAGNDQFICAVTNTVALNGSVSGGTNTGIWSTLGSGSFNPDNTTLNATYDLSTADSVAGNVTLVLTSTGNGACAAKTDTVKITITTTANALAGNDTTVCSNVDSLHLAGVINGGTGQGQWSTNGTGTFSPSNTTLNAWYVPSAADLTAGSVVLKLTPINACAPTADSLVLTLSPAPVVNAGIDQFVCTTTNTVSLNGSVTGGTTTGDWSTLGSGTFNPGSTTLNAVYTMSVADSTAGTVTLVLTSTNNGVCGTVTDTMKIFTTNSTAAVVGADTSICSNDSLALNGAIIGGNAGQWSSTGTGTFSPDSITLNASYIPSAADVAAGSVTLILSPTNGCQPQNDSLVLTFNAAPVVSAGTDIVICASTNTVALNGSVSGGTTTGIWSTNGTGTFTPDATTLNGVYGLSAADSAAGSVTLVLASTNNGSCGAVKDSITVTVTSPASAQAGVDTMVCANNATVMLTGTITGGSGQGQWTTNGSGTFSPADTVLNATYTPSAADITNGNVIITLTPINACAPMGDSLVVTITPAPTANAGNDTTMCGTTTAIALNGSINNVATGAVWTSNGNGTFNPNNTTLNATYTPAVSDNDTLVFVLTTTGNGLCNPVSDTVKIFRNVKPTANFVFSNLCVGQTVSFTDSSTAGVTTWAWDLGGGNTSALQNPSATYPSSGNYSVTLHVSTPLGCADSITKVVSIHPTPTASFIASNFCFGDSVRFTDASTITPGSINSWNWSFGDAGSSTLNNPMHHYDSVKVYTVSLTVVSDSGCSSVSSQTVQIHGTPLAGFTTASTCGSLSVNFSDTSSVMSPDSLIGWNWTFGDAGTSTQQNPSHGYAGTGTYTVLLQVQTSAGCTDTASAVINLGANVTANYIPAGGSYNTGQGIDFTNQSTNGVSYNWTFGDNASSTMTDPSHTFSQPGTYTVTLVASNALGCTDTVAYVFEINTQGVTAPTGFTPDGDGLNDYFYIMGGPFSSYELHIFNEWGNEIFISNSQTDKWDGTYKGVKQPAGTYVYMFKGVTIGGQPINWQKEINLIR